MADMTGDRTYLMDSSGLHELANTTSNRIRTLCLDYLSKGNIVVPIVVWQEFQQAFEDEAEQLAPYVTHKVKMKKAYLVGAASIADRSNPGFSLSPYDNQTDWYAAAICSIEGYVLLTTASQLYKYRKMKCFSFAELAKLDA